MSVETGEQKSRKAKRRGLVAARLPAAIHWHEGMLLAPQHFQTASLRNEVLPYYHTAISSPFHWGLLDLHAEEFDGKVVKVLNVEAVMPDGLVVSWRSRAAGGDNDLGDLELDLTKHLDDLKKGKQTVYLAVASHDAGDQFAQRFDISTTTHVADDESVARSIDLKVLRPRPQLKLFDELPSSYSGFPLMKVELANNTIKAQPFEPPWLRVRAGSGVHSICSEIATRVRNTADDLVKRIKGTSEAGHEPQVLNTTLMLHALVANLLPLEALLDSGVAHPFPLYLATAAVLGSVCVASVPRQLGGYDHHDLRASFEEMKLAVDEVIGNAVKERYEEWAFVWDQNANKFALKIDESWRKRELILGVRIPRDRTQEEIQKWVMGAVIGASPNMESLRERRVTGLSRTFLSKHELIPTDGVIFFRLDTGQGSLLVAGEELVIANPGERQEKRPEEVVLYVKKKD